MTQVYRKFVISEASQFLKETYGFMYDVQVWTSIDNENFYYCGIGRFAKTIEEATAWIVDYEK